MKVRIFAVALLMALVVMVGGVFAQDGTVVDVAAGNEDFSTLVSLVEAAGLVDTLSGEGPFTVFAPTNDAFAELPGFVVEYLQSDTELLSRVLTYHVVPGTVLSTDLSDGPVTTVEGGDVNITVTDMGVTVGAANVVTADVEASNGVIHAIDQVLVPSIDLPEITPAEFSGEIISAGSSTVGPLSETIQEDFEEEGYAGTISNAIIGSGAGFERFCVEGETMISNASRPIRDEEIASCEEIGRNPIEIRVGTDALAVTVNPDNDFIESATFEELQQIFGSAEVWADVNAEWPEEEILRFIPGTDSGTFDYFTEEIFDENTDPILSAGNLQQSEDDNVLLEGVANNLYAAGFFGYAYYDQNQDVLKILNIEGVEPNAANVDNGSYPLARPLFIYTDAQVMNENPQALAFVAYYLNNVNDVIGEVGYFPANDAALNLAKLKVAALLSQNDMMGEDM